eukprot:802966_1
MATETDTKEDETIRAVIKNHNLRLFCLHSDDGNNNEACPSILRLAKQLLIYKNWISKINDNILSTTQVHIGRDVNNDQFKELFMQSIQTIDKINQNKEVVDLLTNALRDDMMNLSVFLASERKTFLSDFSTPSSLKLGSVVKLYSAVLKSLKDCAQTVQFGRFLSDFISGSIDNDYHHILELHIKNGDKTTMENVFRFFDCVLHYNDSSASKQCPSITRMEESEKLHSNWIAKDDNKEETHKIREIKDIWEANQYYIQNQLDMIHSFLGHSGWKCFMDRYVKSDDSDAKDHVDSSHAKSDKMRWSQHLQANKHKYLSDLQESTFKNNYGFGVDHQHPHLKPNRRCIRDELLWNSLYPIPADMFQRFLVKSLKKHRVALGDTYNKQLICKYYKKEFNLIRNEPIAIRHILALVVYSELTTFCTKFRETYRRKKGENDDGDVTQRHLEIYHFSRALYESVEFFGQRMTGKEKVYHGLNCKLYFQKFTAFFNQPMSTSKRWSVACQFADGGIVLTLESAVKSELDMSKIPKCLAISWLSQYPQEEELLFYGDNVLFKIQNITELKGMHNVDHKDVLLILNKFQNIVQNRNVSCTNAEVQKLSEFIATQIQINTNSIGKIYEPSKNYKQALFGYFCNHPKTTSIGINNYHALPQGIKTSLMFEQQSQHRLTFSRFVRLFMHLREIKLNNLNLDKMLQEKQSYIDAVMQHIQTSNNKPLFGVALGKIVLQSVREPNAKDNTTLQRLVDENIRKFNDYQWSITYNFDLTNTLTHNLTFINNNKTAHRMLPLHTKSMDDVQPSKCEWIDRLSYFMQVTSITSDYIRIYVLSSAIHDTMDQSIRLMQIKGVSQAKNEASESFGVNQRLIIKKNTDSVTTDIKIDGTQTKSYHLALFDPKNTDNSLANSNQLKFEVSNHNNGDNYKPHPVDISSVFCVQSKSHVNIFWSVPSFCLGNISYNVIITDHTDEEPKDNATRSEHVAMLPYTIALSTIPISFRIITQTSLNGKTHESDSSKTVIVGDRINEMIQSWNEFPHVLQILSVDADQIEIKFTLKDVVKQKMKCVIETVTEKKSRLDILIVRRGNCTTTNIAIKPNTNYAFTIYLKGKQISNTVCAQTPTIHFHPKYNYSPSAPSVESVRKYYDAKNEHVLIMWDYPKQVVCDTIAYRIKSSNETQQIDELPYTIPTSNIPIQMQICTISTIDATQYQSAWSETIQIAAL